MDNSHVVVCTVQGELEAQQLVSFLDAYGIPAQLRGEALRKTHGLLLDGLGQVEVLVPAGDINRTRALLDQAQRGELALSDDDEDECR
jgi:hypothetical protein